MEVSFSRGETLKGDNIKNKESRLDIFLFSFLIFIFLFDLFSLFRTRISIRVTRSHCYTAGHIR